MTGPRRIMVELLLPDGDDVRGLRAVLKRLLRSHRIRCVSIGPTSTDGTRGDDDGSGDITDERPVAARSALYHTQHGSSRPGGRGGRPAGD
ncbi:MAG: hypothetical protein KAS72_12705 [Phycisphaerales bacterium]|nr:hypothetical protein [Phycisphaerales bacterium]